MNTFLVVGGLSVLLSRFVVKRQLVQIAVFEEVSDCCFVRKLLLKVICIPVGRIGGGHLQEELS